MGLPARANTSRAWREAEARFGDGDTSILVNNHAVLVVFESFVQGKRITVNNGGQLIILRDPDR